MGFAKELKKIIIIIIVEIIIIMTQYFSSANSRIACISKVTLNNMCFIIM